RRKLQTADFGFAYSDLSRISTLGFRILRMGPAAHVTDTRALVEFRAVLCTFADQAKDALVIIDHEIRRTLAFLEERLSQWHSEVRRAEEEVIQAKIDWSQRRNQRIGDR